MNVTLSHVRVGEPNRHKALCVFPLFAEPNGEVDYRLADEAMADESLLVEEISESGSVPDLLVENKGNTRVLFLEGEELIGAKQNRILNTSVLVAAGSKIRIPVSCVEQGRWRHESRYFGSSGSHSPSKLRRELKASVSKSARAKKGHASDQSAVWSAVQCLHQSLNVVSETAAMSDAFETYQDRIAEFRENLKYVDGATGFAVAVGDRIVAIDVFDKPATCRKVWDRMLSGVVFDALEAGEAQRAPSTSDVEQILQASGDLKWEQTEPIGEGDEFRAESPAGDHASVLSLQQTVVHGSVIAAM